MNRPRTLEYFPRMKDRAGARRRRRAARRVPPAPYISVQIAAIFESFADAVRRTAEVVSRAFAPKVRPDDVALAGPEGESHGE